VVTVVVAVVVVIMVVVVVAMLVLPLLVEVVDLDMLVVIQPHLPLTLPTQLEQLVEMLQILPTHIVWGLGKEEVEIIQDLVVMEEL
jgi:hypothetical protein